MITLKCIVFSGKPEIAPPLGGFELVLFFCLLFAAALVPPAPVPRLPCASNGCGRPSVHLQLFPLLSPNPIPPSQVFRRGGHVNDKDGLTDMTMLHYAAKSGAQGDEQLAVR